MSDRIPYWQKLQDPRWQKKRLEIFERDSFTCRYCDAKDKTLEVHHLYYVSGREPWEYPLGTFKTACSDCHRELKLESKESQYWELFCCMENEHNLITGRELPFIINLLLCSHRTGCPDFALLALITDAMLDGLIDHETIQKWHDDLRNSSKSDLRLSIGPEKEAV
jgi:hypothetical protein